MKHIDFNYDEFLQPISTVSPCGAYLKYQAIYDEIKEDRLEEDPSLSFGVWEHELKIANWGQVEKKCTTILKTQSKDIQIAVWYLEALVVTQKFEGLTIGLTLCLKLTKQFWEYNFHPLIIDDNYLPRMAVFHFLAEKLAERIVILPITIFNNDTNTAYSLSDWLFARHNLKIKNPNGVSLKTLQQTILATPLKDLESILENIKQSNDILKELDTFITDKCGNDAPSFRKLYNYFEEIKQIVAKNVAELNAMQKQTQNVDSEKNKQQSVALSGDSDNNDTTSTSNSINAGQSDANMQNTQQTISGSSSSDADTPTLSDAYSTLSDIADFLEHHQPQSPAALLINVAKDIGQKSFQELLLKDAQNGSTIIKSILELYKAFYSPKNIAATENKIPTIEEFNAKHGR